MTERQGHGVIHHKTQLNNMKTTNIIWPYLVPENMAQVVLIIPPIRQPAWTDSTKRDAGAMYGRESAEEVEHAANQSLREAL